MLRYQTRWDNHINIYAQKIEKWQRKKEPKKERRNEMGYRP